MNGTNYEVPHCGVFSRALTHFINLNVIGFIFGISSPEK